VKPVGLSLDEIADQYEECVALVRELTTDLKRFYYPEKGWPPHIDHGLNMGDDEQCIVDLRAAAFDERTSSNVAPSAPPEPGERDA
jgi:hypothetical protein